MFTLRNVHSFFIRNYTEIFHEPQAVMTNFDWKSFSVRSFNENINENV